jgi:hypothetical protein
VPQASESYDLASLNQCVQITGGELCYYSRFNSGKHAEKLYFDLFRNVTKNSGSDVKIKARVSNGYSVIQYFGSFGQRESVDFGLSSIDSDKTFCFQLRNDTKIEMTETVYV